MGAGRRADRSGHNKIGGEMSSPTQRTLKELREAGYLAGVVEKWIPAKAGGFRKDLFGFIDIIAVNDNETLAVQACSGGTKTSGGDEMVRVTKIMQEKGREAAIWLRGPNRRIEVWGWKHKSIEGLSKSWFPRKIEMVLEADGTITWREVQSVPISPIKNLPGL